MSCPVLWRVRDAPETSRMGGQLGSAPCARALPRRGSDDWNSSSARSFTTSFDARRSGGPHGLDGGRGGGGRGGGGGYGPPPHAHPPHGHGFGPGAMDGTGIGAPGTLGGAPPFPPGGLGPGGFPGGFGHGGGGPGGMPPGAGFGGPGFGGPPPGAPGYGGPPPPGGPPPSAGAPPGPGTATGPPPGAPRPPPPAPPKKKLFSFTDDDGTAVTKDKVEKSFGRISGAAPASAPSGGVSSTSIAAPTTASLVPGAPPTPLPSTAAAKPAPSAPIVATRAPTAPATAAVAVSPAAPPPRFGFSDALSGAPVPTVAPVSAGLAAAAAATAPAAPAWGPGRLATAARAAPAEPTSAAPPLPAAASRSASSATTFVAPASPRRAPAAAAPAPPAAAPLKAAAPPSSPAAAAPAPGSWASLAAKPSAPPPPKAAPKPPPAPAAPAKVEPVPASTNGAASPAAVEASLEPSKVEPSAAATDNSGARSDAAGAASDADSLESGEVVIPENIGSIVDGRRVYTSAEMRLLRPTAAAPSEALEMLLRPGSGRFARLNQALAGQAGAAGPGGGGGRSAGARGGGGGGNWERGRGGGPGASARGVGGGGRGGRDGQWEGDRRGGGGGGMRGGGGAAARGGGRNGEWGTGDPRQAQAMLHRTGNAFKIGQILNTSDPEEEKRQKQFKAILNKLTPDNFERLVDRLLETDIPKQATLAGLVDQMFDKALLEVTFSELYSQLCRAMQESKRLPKFSAETGELLGEDADPSIKRIDFRKTLLNKCQIEFEAGIKARQQHEMDEVAEKAKTDDDRAREAAEAAAAEEAEAAETAERERKQAAATAAVTAAREAAEAAEAAADAADEAGGDDAEKLRAAAVAARAAVAKAGADAEASVSAFVSADALAGVKLEDGAAGSGSAAACPLDPKKAALEARRAKAALELANLRARKRMLGNILFIGHLFRQGMLIESIMHVCCQTLLKNIESPDPEDIEALCQLLTTIGGKLDIPGKSGDMVKVYFKRIETLSTNKALESRIRFMLVDLIELRSRRWVARRKVEGPKKVAEIHADAARSMAQGGGGQRGGGVVCSAEEEVRRCVEKVGQDDGFKCQVCSRVLCSVMVKKSERGN